MRFIKINDSNYYAFSIPPAWLHRTYGKPSYILLDEYDTPLHSAHVDNYYDQMMSSSAASWCKPSITIAHGTMRIGGKTSTMAWYWGC